MGVLDASKGRAGTQASPPLLMTLWMWIRVQLGCRSRCCQAPTYDLVSYKRLF